MKNYLLFVVLLLVGSFLAGTVTSRAQTPQSNTVVTQGLRQMMNSQGEMTQIIWADGSGPTTTDPGAPGSYLLNTGDTATGDYTFDTNTLVIKSTSDMVGIGTSTPTYKVHIADATGSEQNLLLLERINDPADNTIAAIVSGTAGIAGINFGDTDADNRAGIRYDNSGEDLSFKVNGVSNRVVFENDGDVGIGNSTPNTKLSLDGTGNIGIKIDGSSGGCLMIRDTDDAGWTECFVLNGVMSCTIDADGICDGS